MTNLEKDRMNDEDEVNLTEEDIEVSVSEVFEQGGKIMATIAEKWINKGKEEVKKRVNGK